MFGMCFSIQLHITDSQCVMTQNHCKFNNSSYHPDDESCQEVETLAHSTQCRLQRNTTQSKPTNLETVQQTPDISKRYEMFYIKVELLYNILSNVICPMYEIQSVPGGSPKYTPIALWLVHLGYLYSTVPTCLRTGITIIPTNAASIFKGHPVISFSLLLAPSFK